MPIDTASSKKHNRSFDRKLFMRTGPRKNGKGVTLTRLSPAPAKFKLPYTVRTARVFTR
jgi:hypothetical protein